MIKEQKTVWDFIEKQVERSHIKRVSWKKIFGMSLTEYITRLKEQGDDTDIAYKRIIEYLIQKGYYDTEMFRRVKISVYARYGEQMSYKKRVNL